METKAGYLACPESEGYTAVPPPTFTLVATDAMAPFVVRHWARISRDGRTATARQLEDAERTAEAMEDWLARTNGEQEKS